MADLPRPEVTTTPVFEPGVSDMQIDVVISRDNKAKSYRGRGATQTDAVSDAVGKVIADGATAEWLPHK